MATAGLDLSQVLRAILGTTHAEPAPHAVAELAHGESLIGP
jgi:hypothetical protein